MTSTWMSSRKNSSTCIQYETTKVEDSYGLAQLKASRKSSLNSPSQHHSLLSRHCPPWRLHLSRLYLLLPTRKDGNSRSCSVIWSSPPSCHPNSTPKSIGRLSEHTNKSAQTLSPALTGTSLNSWEMDSLCTLATPKPMKMIPREPSVLGWEFLLRWGT